MSSPIDLSQLPYIACPPVVAALIRRVERATEFIEGVVVRAFGSSVNGFGDEASDVDLLLAASKANLVEGLLLGKVSDRDLAPRTLAYLQKYLRKEGFVIDEKVLHAKVPILKMSQGKMSCDLSVNNLLPLFNTRLLRSYGDIDPRVVQITVECKRWARHHEVHGAPMGHLSSYTFTMLVIFFMQVRKALPCLQQVGKDNPRIYKEGTREFNVAMDEMPPVDWRAEDCTIDFAEFVRFYVKEFEWGASVVSVRIGSVEPVGSYPDLKVGRDSQDELHIEDPFDIRRNLNCVLSRANNEKLWWALVSECDRLEAAGEYRLAQLAPKDNDTPSDPELSSVSIVPLRRWKPTLRRLEADAEPVSSLQADLDSEGLDPSASKPSRRVWKKGNKISPQLR